MYTHSLVVSVHLFYLEWLIHKPVYKVLLNTGITGYLVYPRLVSVSSQVYAYVSAINIEYFLVIITNNYYDYYNNYYYYYYGQLLLGWLI